MKRSGLSCRRSLNRCKVSLDNRYRGFRARSARCRPRIGGWLRSKQRSRKLWLRNWRRKSCKCNKSSNLRLKILKRSKTNPLFSKLKKRTRTLLIKSPIIRLDSNLTLLIKRSIWLNSKRMHWWSQRKNLLDLISKNINYRRVLPSKSNNQWFLLNKVL